MTIQTLEAMRALCISVLTRSRTSPENAAPVADALLAAEADGVASHGFSRLPAYADQAISGKVDGFAIPAVDQTAAAAVRVDARAGFAYPAIDAGLARAAGLVTETGVVAVAVGNSHHFGAAGYHVESLARQGLVALVFGNGPEAIAPWGGGRALYGTNPIAFACPRAGADPLVIDLALSKVARGKIKLAADRGEPIPESWAVDADGRPTTDAARAMDGALLPIGDAKGAALVLMVEIVAALLTGSNCGFEASSFFTAEGPPPRVGQFFVVLDAERFAGPGFLGRVEALMDAIVAQPGARLPGARRLQARAEARRSGVQIPDALYDDLVRRAEG